jgi:hypothetical protein
MFPSNVSMTRHPLPSRGSPWGEFAAFIGTMGYSDVPTPFPPCFVILRLAVPARVPVFVSPLRPGTGREAWSSVVWQLRASVLRTGDVGTSQVPGEPYCAYALLFDPGRIRRIRPFRCADTAPANGQKRRLPRRKRFRGSITRPWHSLSTLRPAGYPAQTPDTLPVVGRTLRDGIGYPQGSNERFPECSYILSSSPRLCLAQCPFVS